MADRGYTDVHLWEAYPPPQALSKTSSKAYVIVVNPRGQKGLLDATGIDLAKQEEKEKEPSSNSNSSSSNRRGVVVSNHLARHVHNPKTQKTSARTRGHADSPSAIVSRQFLAQRLLDAAEASGVHIHYQHKLQGVDFANRTARFVDASSHSDDKNVEIQYDLLIGADGCHSKVRNLMAQDDTIMKDFSARIEEDSMEYQVATLPENPFASTHPEGTVHSWNHKGHNAMCLGFPVPNNDENNTKHSMLFAIVFPEGKLESFRKHGYDPLKELVPDVFAGTDGTARERLAQVETQLRANQIANGGLCVWSSGLGKAYADADGNSCGVLLLGDSGHGMWPSLGQGANCALETVAVFAKCLETVDDTENDTITSWAEQLVATFREARFEDARAAVDLTYGGIGARKCRGRQNAPVSYKLQMVGMMLLHKMTLGIVPMPAMLKLMIGHSGYSYTTAKKFNFYYEKYICLGALAVSCMGMLVATTDVFSAGTEL
jgi:2-polyprenyl-6-methoxyphenol hydroxylase-like FAD-dependent oxidoreductase